MSPLYASFTSECCARSFSRNRNRVAASFDAGSALGLTDFGLKAHDNSLNTQYARGDRGLSLPRRGRVSDMDTQVMTSGGSDQKDCNVIQHARGSWFNISQKARASC